MLNVIDIAAAEEVVTYGSMPTRGAIVGAELTGRGKNKQIRNIRERKVKGTDITEDDWRDGSRPDLDDLRFLVQNNRRQFKTRKDVTAYLDGVFADAERRGLPTDGKIRVPNNIVAPAR